jgi:hypothetical protein
MEPISIATSVIGMLIPYLVKGGEAIAKKTVDATIEKAGQLYEIIKKKLSDDPYAKETLKRVEEEPNSESRKAALEGVLEEKIKADPALASELEKFLALAKELKGDQISQNIKVSGNSKTGNITAIGKVEGNLDLSQKSSPPRTRKG